MPAPDFFVLQDDNGVTPGANAYCDIDYFVSYCESRGKSIIDPSTTAQFTDTQIAIAIISGRDFMDDRWTYVGFRQQVDQTTEWPRLDAYDNARFIIVGITDILMRANAEYAYIALTSGNLNPIPTRDETGVPIQSKTSQVGPLMKSIHYAVGAVFTQPTYPSADAILVRRGYVISGSRLIRA